MLRATCVKQILSPFSLFHPFTLLLIGPGAPTRFGSSPILNDRWPNPSAWKMA